MTKPAWAENFENFDLDRIEEIVGNRIENLFWQLHWFAEHPFTRFDVTFYKREPILEVTLNKSYTRAISVPRKCMTRNHGDSKNCSIMCSFLTALSSKPLKSGR